MTDDERRTIAEIRRHMAALGADVSHLSDEEIAAGVVKSAEVLAATGVTADEATAALVTALAQAHG